MARDIETTLGLVTVCTALRQDVPQTQTERRSSKRQRDERK